MDIEHIIACFEHVENSCDTFDFGELDASSDPIWVENGAESGPMISNDIPACAPHGEADVQSSNNDTIGAYTKRNIFGGQDIVNDNGSITTGVPNIFGGMNFRNSDGSMTTSMPNIFGGLNFVGSNVEHGDMCGDFVEDIMEFFQFFFDTDSNEFTICDPETLIDGKIDPTSGGIVFGNVAADSTLVDQQNGETCALMAQEQLIEKYYGIDIPEGEMADFAEKCGVFDPKNGTQSPGWNLLLDKFKIPHQRLYDCDANDLLNAVKNGNDVFMAVDMGDYSGNLSFPPGAGHAIVVTGGSIDPQTGEIIGFYVNDSNHAGSPVFKTVEQMSRCMRGDMIIVPDPALC